MRTVLVALILATTASAVETDARGSPVQKVLELMNDIMIKAKQEKQDEKVRFAAFSEFCKVTTVEKEKAIERGQDDMDAAAASIAESEAAADALAKEIATLAANMDTWGGEKAKATALREEQHKIYEKAHAETVDSIESTESAEETIAHGNEGVAQAALLQLASRSHVPARARQLILSFTQAPDAAAAALLQDRLELMGTPEAAAYEGSSGKILEVVVSVEDKLKAEKKELEEREGNSLNAYNLQMASLEGQIKKATTESEFKASLKAEQEQTKASATGALADATKTKEEDQKYLADMKAECTLKTTDFHKRQDMRKQEIEAVTKAIEIMSSDDVSKVALSQRKASKPRTSLAQLRSSSVSNKHPSQRMVAAFLAEKAKKMNSHMLSLLASRATADPFGKVVKMVKDMIQKLMEQANDEADHKAFCDAEMGTNKMTRDTKSSLISQLDATIEELVASINKLAQKANDTVASISEIDANMATATKERQAEKEKNQATIKDSQAAQAATQNAMSVLKTYYEAAANQPEPLPEAEGPIKYDPRSLVILSKATGGGALVQEKQKVPGGPEMESGEYTGAESGGVIGLLEVFESDLMAVISATEAAEGASVREFEQFSTDSSQDKAVKQTELKHQQDTKTAKESDLQAAKTDLKSAKSEMQAATDYYEKLKPSCVEVAVSYEDRVAARKEEIESLQEALTILSEDSA